MLHVGELVGDGIGGHYCAEKRIKRKSRARLMFSVMEQQNMTDYSPRLLSRVGIQWRADDLLFDFETCPNYQKIPQIVTDLRQPCKIYNRCVKSARH